MKLYTYTHTHTMCQYLLEVKSGLTNIVICQLDDLWWTWKQSWALKTLCWASTWSSVTGSSGRTRALCSVSARPSLASLSLLGLTTLLWHFTLFVCFPPQFVIPGIHEKGKCKQRVLKFWQFWKFLFFPYFLFHYYS